MEDSNNILVAIKCLTYNHEHYIRDCLDGFIMQKTDFRFVVIVHDDASTDKTVNIIKEYEGKYPDIIKPIFESENQYSIYHDFGFGGVIDNAIDATGAKYVAICEGDDYWIDPFKLQKQVDFLEEHNEYSLCFHKCNMLVMNTGEITDEFVTDMPGESTILDLAKINYIHTLSVVFRKNDRLLDDFSKLPHNLAVGDYTTWMLLSQYGKIMKLPDIMAVYRYGSGIWSTKPLSFTTPRWCIVLLALIRYFEDTRPDVSEILEKQMYDTIESSLKEFERKEDYSTSRAYCIGKFILWPFSGLKRMLRIIRTQKDKVLRHNT